MRNLFILRLLFDFGLLVLIWIVQLIIYPSFQYYSNSNLETWHPIYTKAISCVVIPLMLGQLIVSIFQILKVRNPYTIISFGCIVIVWLLTFLIFVPIHNVLGSDKIEESNLVALVNLNWFRTGLWSLIFLLNGMALKKQLN